MRIRRFMVALGLVLATAGGITAQQSSACTIPCTAQPKAMGVILGGGIPGDAYGFTFHGQFRGLKNGHLKTQQFSTFVGGYSYTVYDGYSRYIYLGDDAYPANVDYQVIPGFGVVPDLGVITLSTATGGPTVNGQIVGYLGNKASKGSLVIK